MLTECQSLTPLEGKTGADVVRKFVEVGEQYNECAKGKKALVEAVRQAQQ